MTDGHANEWHSCVVATGGSGKVPLPAGTTLGGKSTDVSYTYIYMQRYMTVISLIFVPPAQYGRQGVTDKD